MSYYTPIQCVGSSPLACQTFGGLCSNLDEVTNRAALLDSAELNAALDRSRLWSNAQEDLPGAQQRELLVRFGPRFARPNWQFSYAQVSVLHFCDFRY